jgi:hypothetical protein
MGGGSAQARPLGTQVKRVSLITRCIAAFDPTQAHNQDKRYSDASRPRTQSLDNS